MLSFDYITLGLGKSRLSFELTNLFPSSSWACVVSSPYPVPFLHLLRFCVRHPIQPFAQARYLPFIAIFTPTAHASCRKVEGLLPLLHPGFCCACPAEEFTLYRGCLGSSASCPTVCEWGRGGMLDINSLGGSVTLPWNM